MKVLGYPFLLKCMLLVYTLAAVLDSATAGRRRIRTQRPDLSEDVKGKEKAGGKRNRHSRSDYVTATNVADDVDDEDEVYDDVDADEWANLSTTNEIEEPEVVLRKKKIDPKRSWMSFVRYTGDRGTDNKPDRRKKKRKRKNRSKALFGPPGPPGPQGPPGPPGPSISKEEIIEELRDLIAETAEKRAQEMFAEMLANSNSSSPSIPLPESSFTSGLLSVPRIYAGFSMHMASKTSVRRKTYMEMKSFKQPFGSGSFQRGNSFNTKAGRFSAPRDGVYQFSAALHLRVRAGRRPKSRGKGDSEESLRVVICIDSLCKTNTSLETITGIAEDRGTFTVRTSGILELKEKQYVSVYVDNSSNYRLSVLQGSEYSGLFIGV